MVFLQDKPVYDLYLLNCLSMYRSVYLALRWTTILARLSSCLTHSISVHGYPKQKKVLTEIEWWCYNKYKKQPVEGDRRLNFWNLLARGKKKKDITYCILSIKEAKQVRVCYVLFFSKKGKKKRKGQSTQSAPLGHWGLRALLKGQNKGNLVKLRLEPTSFFLNSKLEL